MAAGWIDSVVSHATIRSVWGNDMRDRVVHQFATRADRNANAIPQEGMCCHCADIDTLYVYTGGAWWVLAMPWRSFTPVGYAGSPGAGPTTVLPAFSTDHAVWAQSMGQAFVSATYTVSATAFVGTPIGVSGWVPAAALYGGGMGAARLYQISNGLNYGGQGLHNGDTAGGSYVTLVNVGNGVPPWVTVTPAAGETRLEITLNCVYPCSPTVDL